MFRNFVDLKLSWVDFLIRLSYAVCLVGLVLTAAAALYFSPRLSGGAPEGAGDRS